jgi:hypothetical protein
MKKLGRWLASFLATSQETLFLAIPIGAHKLILYFGDRKFRFGKIILWV